MLRAPQILGTPSSYAASDSFTGTTAGNALNSRVAPTGGTWATSGEATGDFLFADDFSDEQVRRTSSSSTTGRFAVLGSTNYTNVIVETRLAFGSILNNGQIDGGLIARWTNSANHLRGCLIQVDSGVDTRRLEIRQVVASVETILATMDLGIPIDVTQYVLRLTVLTNGQATLALLNQAKTSTIATLVGSSSALATAGTLATGLPGLFDRNTSTDPVLFARIYDDFRVTANLALDAVLYPSQSAELRTSGIFREDTGGTSYARVESVVGCLPRLPPSGLENRKVELYVKASRGDFDEYPDTGIDDLSAQVFYRPAWLLTPGS